MIKQDFKKKLLSAALSALTAFSAGSAALTTAIYTSAPVVYAAESLTPQESKLLKAEEKMIMGMAKTVFNNIPFFGNLVDGFDSILELTDAFGSGSGDGSISKEDLKELREHLDTELEKINQQITSMGDTLLNELGNEMYTMKIGDVVDDMYNTAIRDAERINTHLSDDSLTENEKLVEIAALIGRSNTWSNSDHKLSKFWKVANLISGETVTKIDSKNLYDTIYEYFSKKVLFSGEAYDKATPYINKIVYEFLYSQSVLAQCLGASLKVANFTEEEIAALSPTQKSIIARSTVKSIEDEIGAETMMLFNFHDQKSFISLYSQYLYNAENSRYTYLDKGHTIKAVKSELAGYEPGRENDVGTIKVIETNGRNDTNAHNSYNNEKTRLQKALNNRQYVSSAKIGEMGSYVSANYKSTKTVWTFLKDRGFSITAPDSNTNMLVSNANVKEWGRTNSQNKWGEYNKDQYEGYTGFVYNKESLTPEDVSLYVLNHRKETDPLAYQAIAYNHFYQTYTPDSIKSKPVRIFFFEEPSFKNDSVFSFDPSTNALNVNAKAAGAAGRQSVKVQYRADSDDAWTTSYAPTLSMTLKGGCDYEIRTVISDEAGHKETTDTFYCSTAVSVNYIDADGTEKTTPADTIKDSSTALNAGWYAVTSDTVIDSRITCRGDVHLILCDDCTLTVPNGITVNENEATLTIYGQNAGTGTVDAGSQNASWAAIGGTNNNCGGLITINGGTVCAKANYAGAGIGGGQRHPGTAAIVINGGTVKAEAAEFAAGIGGGARGSADITINGGNISVNGKMGYGIGGGSPSAEIKLSWKKATDSIAAGSYNGSVTLEKLFTDGSDVFAPDKVSDNSSINGKTLTPADKTAFTVTWMNADKVLQTDQNVPIGTIPRYNGKAPEKESDEQYDYTFSGWSPDISKVTRDITYQAQFSSNPHTYGAPVWTWSADHSKAAAAFTCSIDKCRHTETVEATVVKTEDQGKVSYTATVIFNGREYSATYGHIHSFGEPTWTWYADHTAATAVFTCQDCHYRETLDAVISITDTSEKKTYTATVVFLGKLYTDQYEYVHSYNEPVWDWAEDFSSATATFTETDSENKITVSGVSTKTETPDKTTCTVTVEFNGKTYTNTVTPLKNLSVPSSYTIGKNDKVTIYCLSEYGLSKEVFYTVKYSRYGDSATAYWYTLQTDSKNSVIEFTPANENVMQKTGPYTFKVEAVNILENGKRYTTTKTFVVNVGDPFQNTSSIYHTFHPVGEKIYVTCHTEGGMGASTNALFSIYYKRSDSDTWTAITERSIRSSFMYFVPKAAGQYDVRVEAFDVVNDKIVNTAVKDLTVIAHDPLVNSSFVSSHSGYTTDPIIVNCSAEGGVGSNIVYTVSYKKIYDYNWTVLQKEDENATVSFTPTSTATYIIRVTAVNIVEGYDEHIEVYKDFEVKVDKKHVHSFGEPTWQWSDDHVSAKAAFTCTDCGYTETVDAEVTKTEDTDKVIYTAAVTFGGKTYTDTYTEEKEETYVYYPAAEPYIDDSGAYILGYKEHYRYQGKYYAVNKDHSVGDEITDIWVSYFKFALLPDDTYAIEYYTGKTKNLTEIVIPKTFNGKKVTTLGTDHLDVFIKAGKPQFELVLNENIAEIKPCAFNKIGVTKVTGNTSGLGKIGEYAFSWVNKTGGYALDITLTYPGMITTGDAVFNQVNAVIHLGHETTFSNMDFRTASITFDFMDAHTYSEPDWEWNYAHDGATATFTCTDDRCQHTEAVNAAVSESYTTSDDGEVTVYYKATADFNGKTYTDLAATAYIALELFDDTSKPDHVSSTVKVPDNAPKTGDTASAAAITATLLGSLTAALFLAIKRRKTESESSD